ncbi:N-6 DNA methylase [Nocardioides sp. HDW12B]|nr:N-6 DNA methylase [Nocardioides sp. HDW12B]
MRKDAGLNGDLDRIPQLAWLLFLKAFDALEENREIVDESFRPSIEAPYRWRDWAADPNGATGDALLKFVDGSLLPYLRGLSGAGAHDPRDVLAAVFKETNNRMVSGYLLRDVVNKVSEINFASSDDIHTMAHLYESMLREVRDAAGDSGEFYTPRPVIRFITQQVDPKLGEVVLDPACGTGGFLVEALEHMSIDVETARQGQALHQDLRGIEKKQLPFLLGMMNLVLHGVGQPNLVRGNALSTPITQIGKAQRVDVVLTNPPFGGAEEATIQANFPAGKRTAETAWLFIQAVIRRLKDGGRCGIVVPNGVLFGDGVGAKIKQQLLEECNLHTVLRLPAGVFEPYTDIPTNVLFFDKGSPTKEVWFYQITPPEGRKKYTKTKPMHFDEFAECQAWWRERAENSHAWRVPVPDIEQSNFNLDFRNPHSPDDLAHRAPLDLIGEALAAERQLVTLLEKLGAESSAAVEPATAEDRRAAGWTEVKLGDFLRVKSSTVSVDPSATYKIAGVYSYGRGLIDRGELLGSETSYTTLGRLEKDTVVISKLGAWEGAVAVVSDPFADYYVSSEFPRFEFYSDLTDAAFFAGLAHSPSCWEAIDRVTRGSMARRKRTTPTQFLETRLWLPPKPEQARATRRLALIQQLRAPRDLATTRQDALAPSIFNGLFSGAR